MHVGHDKTGVVLSRQGVSTFSAPDLYVHYLVVITLEVCCTPCEGGDTPGS